MTGDLPRPVSARAAEAVADRLRVLGQPIRVRLIDLLEREGELSVGAVAETLGESLHNVSQHLAVLRSAGIVQRRRRGREVGLNTYRAAARAGDWSFARRLVSCRGLGRAVRAPEARALHFVAAGQSWGVRPPPARTVSAPDSSTARSGATTSAAISRSRASRSTG
ncbi:MAG: helix-turn-helix transcriptional regulator [Thermoleophilaceae bacterium]|nr:helix-turn-helix transcriptional regulator [Thermoleophilaceae bacterium]